MSAPSSGCRRQAEVLRATDEGSWSPELRAHAERCDACREAAGVAWLRRRTARELDPAPGLPNASALLWRARLRRRHDRRQAGAHRVRQILDGVRLPVAGALLLALLAAAAPLAERLGAAVETGRLSPFAVALAASALLLGLAATAITRLRSGLLKR